LKKEKSIFDRKWDTLIQFREYLEKNTNEKIESFNGWQLVTNKGTYSIAWNQLYFDEKK
jgi:hypothetical protein